MSASRPNVQIAFHDDAGAVQPASVTTIAPFGRWLFGAVLLFVLAAAVAVPSIRGEWLPRDDRNVTENTALRAWPGWKLIWLRPWTMPQLQPVSYTALLFEHQLFRNEPLGYHTVNLLLHVACTLLFWTMLRKLDLPFPLLCAAVFAVHPVNVATVAWVSQQKLLLCGVFYLCALLVYLRYTGLNPPPVLDDPNAPLPPRLPSAGWLLYSISIVLLALALGSHGLAVTFAPVVALLIWWRRGRLTRGDVLPLILPATMCALAAAAVILKEHRALGGDTAGLPTLLQRVQLLGWSVWISLRHVLAPLRLQYVYERWPLAPTSVLGYVPTIAVIAALLGLWCLRPRLGRGPLATALLYLVLLLPGSGIVTYDWLRESYIADHLQYLATAVLIVSMVAAISGAAKRAARSARLGLGAGAVAIVAVLTVAGVLRATNYQTRQKLWQSTLDAAGRDTVVACNGIAMEALAAGDDNTAYTYAVRALAVDPDNVQASLAVGEVFKRRREFDRAISQYQRILQRDPQHVEARAKLAGTIAAQGDSSSAMLEYQRVLEINPRHTLAWHNLGELHASRGELTQAVECYQKALEIDPRYVASRSNLAFAYYYLGDLEKCVNELNAIIEIDPRNYEAYLNAGAFFGTLAGLESKPLVKKQALEKSSMCFRMAISLNPKSPEAFANFGKMQAKRSQLETRDRALPLLSEAISAFRKARQLRPDYQEVEQLERMAVRDRDDREARRDEIAPSSPQPFSPRP